MDDSMDYTNLKANMVLIHAVYVWSEAPTHCLLDKDFYLDLLMLTRPWEVPHVQLLLSQNPFALLRSGATVTRHYGTRAGHWGCRGLGAVLALLCEDLRPQGQLKHEAGTGRVDSQYLA